MISDYLKMRGIKFEPELHSPGFEMVDDGGVEVETGELLYGFVRRLKPSNILETGTYSGISAAYIALALQRNERGELTTVEIDHFHIDRATKMWKQIGVEHLITPVNASSLLYTPNKTFQMIFLDREPDLRLHELVRFYPYLEDGGYVFIHDLPSNWCKGNVNPDHPEMVNWPVGEIPKEAQALIDEKKLLPFYFPDARSLAGFYKPMKGDNI